MTSEKNAVPRWTRSTLDEQEIRAHGFDGYISKLIDEELLRKTLREVLDGNE